MNISLVILNTDIVTADKPLHLKNGNEPRIFCVVTGSKCISVVRSPFGESHLRNLLRS